MCFGLITPENSFVFLKKKSLVNFGWNGGYLQISPILTIAIPSPFSYQGHFKFSGWPNKWNLNGFGCLFESCPRAGENKCSVLPGGSSGSPSLLESIPCPFPPPFPTSSQNEPEKGFVDCYLMISHCWWLPPGVRMLWWDPCLRSHCFMAVSMSLSSLGWITAVCSTWVCLWSSLGRCLYYHFSQHF